MEVNVNFKTELSRGKKRKYHIIYHLIQVMSRLWSTKYLLASLKLQPNYIYLEQLIHKMNLQFYTAQQF